MTSQATYGRFPRPALWKGHVSAQNSSFERLGPPRGVLFGSFRGSCGTPCDCLYLLPVKEKAISEPSGNARIAFPPCLSRKRRFQGVARKPRSVPFRRILGTSSGPSRSPFPVACQRKGCFRAPWACSRWPFPPACRGKGNFKALLGIPQSAQGALEVENTPIVNKFNKKLTCFHLAWHSDSLTSLRLTPQSPAQT